MPLPSYVGRFEVRGTIATGGFAIVLKAWDEDLESPVAIKVLREELAQNEQFQLRFLEEARLLRRIRSPHVVTVHDVGRLSDSRPYFVMDFADRGTLAQRFNRVSVAGSPDRRSIAAIVDALADGITAIHEAGVVHRDIKPANLLFQSARRGPAFDHVVGGEGDDQQLPLVEAGERILVGDLGIAKDLVKRTDAATMIAGTPLYQAPEQDDPDAVVAPTADVYSATALLWHVLTGRRPPGAARVAQRVRDMPAAWRDVLARGMAVAADDRFPSMESWHSAVHETLERQVADAREDPLTELAPREAPCPYKGLAAYQPEDADYFFGREALVDDLVRRLHLHKVLVVGGASGSGKSSLVRAGLIPALKAGALPGSDGWQVALFTPGRDPLADLYVQVTRNPEQSGSIVSLEEILARPTLARHLGAGRGEAKTLLLCIDQFEELFTLAPEAQRSKFVEALSAMTDPADSSVRIAIAIRADFYAACAQIPWLAERITDNQVLVGPMSRSELRRAISEPARRAGSYLEAGLVDQIIDDAGHETGSLPLVAHALVETWMRRRGATLTVNGYRAAGGVAGAISQTADATFEQRFNEIEREATKRLLLRLVTPGEGTPDTRRIVGRAEISSDPRSDVLHRVVACLTEGRLLTVDDESVQIAHEALIRTWPRLRAWIDESRDDLRMRQRVSHAAAEWEGEGRDRDLLYRGTPLLAALEWAERNPDQVGARERSFLEASAAAKAHVEAIAAERARKTRKFRRIAFTLLSFLALGATAASAVAFVALRDARLNEKRAALATVEAHNRFAAALGSAALGLVDKDPLLALALGAEALARVEAGPPSFDARAAMVAARRALSEDRPFPLGSAIAAGDALAIALSGDGLLLAVAKRDGDIDIIDTLERRTIGTSLEGHGGGVRNVDFSPDGRKLASVGADGTVRLWVIDGSRGGSTTLGELSDEISGVSFSPDGTSVASANGDGTVRLWDVARAQPIGEPLVQREFGFQTVEFSPDGRNLLAGHKDGSVYGWALPSGEPLFEPVQGVHTSKVLQLAFSPSGRWLATLSGDQTSHVLHYPSGRPNGQAFAHADPLGAVVFAPDRDVLIGGGAEGALRLWDVAKRKPVSSSPSGHSGLIVDAELSGDGRLLTTLGRDQLIRFWTLGRPYPLSSEREVAGGSAKGLALSGDGTLVAVGTDNGIIEIWELDEDRDSTMLKGHDQQVWALAFSPDGALLASGDRGGEVRLWDSDTGTPKAVIAGEGGPIWSVAFTPDATRLLAGSDGGLRVWDVETGEPLASLEVSGGRLTRAALSPDGAVVAVASTDGRVRLWDLATSNVTTEIVADDDVVWSVAFSPDGRRLATASSDEVVALWDLESGERLAAYTGHTGGATDVAYLRDGVTLVVVDRSGMVHLWDVRTGRRLIEPWQAHDGASWRLAVHADGEQFATAGDDGTVKIWDEFSVDKACAIAGAAFDVVRRQQYLGDGEESVACDRDLVGAQR